MCPKNFDPLHYGQNSRTIIFEIACTGAGLSGTLGVIFQGIKVFLPLSSPTAAKCEAALEAHPRLGQVTCSYSPFNSGRAQTITITFTDWPAMAADNNMFQNDGNPSIDSFYCDITNVGDPTTKCRFTNSVNTNIKSMI